VISSYRYLAYNTPATLNIKLFSKLRGSKNSAQNFPGGNAMPNAIVGKDLPEAYLRVALSKGRLRITTRENDSLVIDSKAIPELIEGLQELQQKEYENNTEK
tara:strand:- start:447 stop:752 length:306 start_codon:yes stop_codon:yes gene_type:complete